MSFLDYDEARMTALMRRRLQAQKLPAAFIKTRVDAYVDAVSQLIESVTVAYNLMDEEDPNRETLAACCQSQIDAWADEMTAPPDVPTPPQELQDPEAQPVNLLKRARRPLLDRYFDLNAYPSVTDKKALAAHEGATYRQIHVWFQNRRAKARAMNIPLRKCDTSPEMASALLEQALFEDDAEEQSPFNEPLKSDTDDMSLPWMQDQPSAVAESPRARLQSEFNTGTPLHQSVSRHRPSRDSRRSKPVDMDDLITAFDAMNVRGAGTRTAIGAEKGYAARTAITYVAPKAPLPSYIPPHQLSYAPPMMTSGKPALAAPTQRKLLGLPKRKPAARRRLTSMSSDSSRSSSPSSDRVPSLTYSDSSDSSSSPSPEPPTCFESLPSPPSPTWVDLPSPSFPIIVSPPGLIAHETPSSLTWREDAGAEGDDEDDSWDRAAQRAMLGPSKPRRKTSKQKTARPPSRPSRSRSAVECARSPASDPRPVLPVASDDVVFNGVTTAVVQDGIERLPGWDELDLSILDVDPTTAGELDIQIGTWDSSNATLPASQCDFGPVATFGDAPSAPVAEVQSEPEREQTVDESPANTDVDSSAWATQLSGWNDNSSLITVDNLGFNADFAPSAFDGFIASNWNLEPAQEPSSTPSTLFGRPGFEASNVASTTQSATDVTASNPTNPSTLGATVPETTFTFGSESTQPTFKFGASTSTASAAATPTPAPTSSSSALKSAVPSTTFTFGKPAATQRSNSKAPSSSTFTFGAQSTATPTFAFSSTPSTFRSSLPSVSSSSFSCAPSSFAFGTGLPGPFTFGISA
ncbi:uncharacterized protein SCHCODRAFT_02610278 [Schizophyllum commune H4-8]|nr:uncharacterized protein SCHCODRAFT_02610278 [Schizophyllum commune H4-8]KAI5897800.1 hypothetical protein SCHCODRAFT_02610278 [Schizophyllum commune H4-8]